MANLPIDPRLQAQMLETLNMSQDRLARVDPVHQAAMAMAMHMAPNYAKAAIQAPQRTSVSAAGGGPLTTGTSMPSAPASLIPPVAPGAFGGGAGSPSGPGLGSTLAPGLAAGLGALAANGGLQKLIDLIKKQFQANGIQGNKPNAGGALTGPGAYDPRNFMGWNNGNDQGPSAYDPSKFMGWADPLKPNVSTDTSFGFDPSTLFGNGFDPNNPTDWNLLYSLFNGMPNDPSGGTGVGPGMQGFRGNGDDLNNTGYSGPGGNDWGGDW